MSVRNIAEIITRHPLNRNAKVRAAARFAAWQVKSRIFRRDHIHQWINQSKFWVRKGETGLTVNIYTGLYEFPEMAFLLHVLRPGDLFIDVGANAGSYTILASAVAGANSISFEPVPSTFDRLLANVRLNQIDDRVQCINSGVGKEKGRLTFSKQWGPVNHVVASNETIEDTVEVVVDNLDALVAETNPFMIKVDVEGYETPVFEGAQSTLGIESLQVVIVELNGSGLRYGFDETKIVRNLVDNGFRSFSYDPLTRNLAELNGKNDKSDNSLFIRGVDDIHERVKMGPHFTVNNVDF